MKQLPIGAFRKILWADRAFRVIRLESRKYQVKFWDDEDQMWFELDTTTSYTQAVRLITSVIPKGAV